LPVTSAPERWQLSTTSEAAADRLIALELTVRTAKRPAFRARVKTTRIFPDFGEDAASLPIAELIFTGDLIAAVVRDVDVALAQRVAGQSSRHATRY